MFFFVNKFTPHLQSLHLQIDEVFLNRSFTLDPTGDKLGKAPRVPDPITGSIAFRARHVIHPPIAPNVQLEHCMRPLYSRSDESIMSTENDWTSVCDI
jgi:hypothetical protein